MTERALLTLLYALSGALGLIYEIAWSRRLQVAFGGSPVAITTILAAFMGGLALGSWLRGRRVRSAADPVGSWGRIEIALGAFAFLSPELLDGLEKLLPALLDVEEDQAPAFILFRFIVFAAALVPPAALMGATVPLITEAFARWGRERGRAFGVPFAVNTLGAVGGTLVAAFLLLPGLGLVVTLRVAAAASVLAGLAAVGLAARLRRRGIAGTAAEVPAPETEVAGARLVPILVAAAGAGGMALEVLHTRALGLVLGSTAYAFALMLAVWLLGLGGGALLMARMADRLRRPMVALAVVLLGCGAAALSALFVVNELPWTFLRLRASLGTGRTALVAAQGAVAAILLLPSAAASGMVLPLAVRLEGGAGARRSGSLYAWNTWGGIAGLSVTTFALIPLLSVRMTIAGVSCVLSLLAAVAAVAAGSRAARILLLPAAAVAAAALVLPPQWRPDLVTTAVYRYAPLYAGLDRDAFRGARGVADLPVLFDEDGLTGRVTVVRSGDGPGLLLDGKGASGGGDVPTEILLAQLPILLHGNPRAVLIIGHGGGVTAASALVHRDIAEVVSVEIEPAVLRAASHFGFFTLGRESDPRLRVVRADGRGYLASARRTFDVIASQPSNPWVSGAAALFTREAFERGRGRLAPGGVFCQWLQMYETSWRNLAVLVRTFAAVFPHAALFRSRHPADLLLAGSDGPLRLPVSRLLRFLEGDAGLEMRRATVLGPASFLGLFRMGRDDMASLGAPHRELNTDDNAFIEYALPFDLLTDRSAENGTRLDAGARGLHRILDASDLPPVARAELLLAVGQELLRAGLPSLAAECAALARESPPAPR